MSLSNSFSLLEFGAILYFIHDLWLGISILRNINKTDVYTDITGAKRRMFLYLQAMLCFVSVLLFVLIVIINKTTILWVFTAIAITAIQKIFTRAYKFFVARLQK
ncbi:hypothetical protein [Oscillibacter sp.]|uniref:hypothetical protein n=1 Tax=Oscillibacter sp. TaxID=1945593 RepID=UPI0028AF3307|nr:hypothetical protein [Oscillibacter sp.]